MRKVVDMAEDTIEPIDVLEPGILASPLVIASPHSGDHYPKALIEASCLSKFALRRSEDSYIDDLFASACQLGAPVLKARYARAYLDLNREPYELDPDMFHDTLPNYCNTSSARVAAGLGTIARIVANQKEIYARKLTFTDAEDRINRIYKPYHARLRHLVNQAKDRFGYCVLIDCHSMPSVGLPNAMRHPHKPVDVVLGDRNGLSCSASLTEEIERLFGSLGYAVLRNNPYAGGYTTQHYGDPTNGVHVVQIELNRGMYMDEETLNRRASFSQLKEDIRQVLAQIAEFSHSASQLLSQYRMSAE